MTAIDYPRIPQIWTPDRTRRANVCPKCGKRKRGWFERKRDEMMNRMPVNGCCCTATCSACPLPLPASVLITISGTNSTNVVGTNTVNGTWCLTPDATCVVDPTFCNYASSATAVISLTNGTTNTFRMWLAIWPPAVNDGVHQLLVLATISTNCVITGTSTTCPGATFPTCDSHVYASRGNATGCVSSVTLPGGGGGGSSVFDGSIVYTFNGC